MFQYWDKVKPPNEVQRMMRSWKNHPGYRLFLFSHPKARSFIKHNFPEAQFNAFMKCAVPAMQADFFRYCILYKHGGIYIDADIRLGEGKFDALKEIIDSTDRGLIMTRQKAIANDFIFVRRPEDPLIAKVIETATANIENKISNNVWEVTGPGIMTQLYESGEHTDLFDNYFVSDFKIMREIVEFKWRLNYKKGDGHWTKMQEKQSIYTNENKK